MDWISFAYGEKGLFSYGLGRDWMGGVQPPLGVGFVYDTPLKNFPPF
jgi:hypothetical protein